MGLNFVINNFRDTYHIGIMQKKNIDGHVKMLIDAIPFFFFILACIRVWDKVHGDQCKGQHQCGKCM